MKQAWPNRLPLTNLVAVSAIVCSTAVFWILGLPAAVILSLVLVMILPALLGYMAAQRIQTADRTAFALLDQANKTNEKLSREVERAKALELKLTAQALTDPLTGLSKRREYELLLNREFARCKRHGVNVVVGMIDLDHFKRINDRYGHDFGDQMLRYAARVLQSPLRRADTLGRFGGEEFIRILPDTSLEQAKVVAERMLAQLESSSMIKEGESMQLTATFALTEISTDDDSVQHTIRRADAALYEGKSNGRNCVMTAKAA